MSNGFPERTHGALDALAGVSYKRWLLVAAVLFIIGLILGTFSSSSFSIYDTEYIEELAESLIPLSAQALMIIILINNIIALSISFFLSPIFVIVPILSLLANGWVLAAVGGNILQQESFGYLMAGILPHGVFEIPAFIMAQAAALSFGTMAVIALFVKEKRPLLKPNLKQNLKYLIIATLLMIPAAVIEVFITPLLLD